MTQKHNVDSGHVLSEKEFFMYTLGIYTVHAEFYKQSIFSTISE